LNKECQRLDHRSSNELEKRGWIINERHCSMIKKIRRYSITRLCMGNYLMNKNHLRKLNSKRDEVHNQLS
jgi:hypothetical protein